MLLTDFSIFDPTHDNELVSLSLLEKGDPDMDRAFEGVGDAREFLLDDEDAGQEDDLGEPETTRIRLGAIFHFSVDYTREDEWVFDQRDHSTHLHMHFIVPYGSRPRLDGIFSRVHQSNTDSCFTNSLNQFGLRRSSSRPLWLRVLPHTTSFCHHLQHVVCLVDRSSRRIYGQRYAS